MKIKLKNYAARALSPLFLLSLFTFFSCFSDVEAASQILKAGWQIQSSLKVTAPGEMISSAEFKPSGWYSTSVPSTVFSALVKNDVYRDVFFAKNMETISSRPFRVSWWYRTEFDMQEAGRAETAQLLFRGINFSANIFLNGTKIGGDDSIAGAFRIFSFDISPLVKTRGNVLAVEVFPPQPGDFTLGFVDWNPTPPDNNMGIWREVEVRTSGAVSIQNPFVQTRLNTDLTEAQLTLSATIVNHTDKQLSGKATADIKGVGAFSQDYTLAPKKSADIEFKPTIKNPRVWWPNNLGSPELYTAVFSASDGRGVSDTRKLSFGIREVGDYINEQGHRGYTVNGKKVLIRGGGWVDDLLLDEDPENLEAQIQYVKHMNLNTIRLEGFWGSTEKLYDLADRYGILIMVGWSCQWEWTHYLGKEAEEPFGGIKSESDMQLVTQYLRDQVLWLRNHPSIFVWAIGSDMLPNPEMEKRERAELARLDPGRPVLSSAKSFNSEVSGPTAVKMAGPYDYVTPNYWYEDKENGGAFGFNTETGPGPQPPPAESIEKMFAKEHYWPIDDTWNYHCGRNEFNNMDRYMNAFNKRYGPAEDFYDFTKRAQAANYEAIRPMFEAFGVRKPIATGVIQWMLNAAWPKMYWQLYDYYLLPGGAFYATRKANQPLNIVYDYSDRSIHIVNDRYSEYPELTAEIRLLSVDSKSVFTKQIKTSAAPYESKRILQLPAARTSPVYFLSLKLNEGNGKPGSDNFYWLSGKPDVLDEKGTDWYFTPNKAFADFSALNKLPDVSIEVEQQWIENGVTVTLKNPGNQTAFFIELKLVDDKTGRSIVPVFWDDNYVSLLPGETKQISARYWLETLRGLSIRPVLWYSGWNVKEVRTAAVRSTASGINALNPKEESLHGTK